MALSQVLGNTPVSHLVVTKVAQLARTDTTAKKLFVLPKGAVVTGYKVFVSAVSNAGTTAVISVGDGTTPTLFLNAVDVKGAAGLVAAAAAAGNMFSALASDVTVYGVYAETGAASTLGGPFYVSIEYIQMGPGEIIN